MANSKSENLFFVGLISILVYSLLPTMSYATRPSTSPHLGNEISVNQNLHRVVDFPWLVLLNDSFSGLAVSPWLIVSVRHGIPKVNEKIKVAVRPDANDDNKESVYFGRVIVSGQYSFEKSNWVDFALRYIRGQDQNYLNDWVVIKLDNPITDPIKYLNLMDLEDDGGDTNVCVLGYPSLYGSNIAVSTGGCELAPNSSIIDACPVSPGFSGGAVISCKENCIDEMPRLVGIVAEGTADFNNGLTSFTRIVPLIEFLGVIRKLINAEEHDDFSKALDQVKKSRKPTVYYPFSLDRN